MKFFIDTANLDQIREANELGVLDGVTTNPSLMAKEGIKGVENQRRHYIKICEMVDGDVSAEVIATDYEGMIKEGEELAGLNPHIVVKVPCIEAGIKAIKVNKFELSPLTEALIEARFLGPDPAVLDSLTGVAIDIMRRNPKVTDARNEWGNMTYMIRPVYDPVKAGFLGITKANLIESVKSIEEGTVIGIYRDEEKKVPVLLKSEKSGIDDPRSLGDFSVWNGEKSAPLSQVTRQVTSAWEYPQIKTYNRQLSMAAMCGVKNGYTMSEVHGEIREEIEKMNLPQGYSFFWDSQYKDQTEGLQALVKFFPLAFLMLVVILVALFSNFRQPIIILCVLPLSLIGVTIGMLLTGFDFGFFPIAGWLGLLGMIIKNVIVLLDEINTQRRNGISPYDSIIEATISRTRPVLMAATTTILGMVPLLFDAFGGMAATIIFGLTFATLLTLFVTPTLYALFYRIHSPHK